MPNPSIRLLLFTIFCCAVLASLSFAVATGETVPTVVACRLSRTSIKPFDEVTISGSITPPMVVELFLVYKNTDWTDIAVVETDAYGTFVYFWSPHFSGNIEVAAYFMGDATYNASISEWQPLTIAGRFTEITCTTNSTPVSLGTPVLLEGALTPPHYAAITLQYTTDTLWTTITPLTTEADGSYRYAWTPLSSGSYAIQATYPGSDDYDACVSAPVSLEVHKLASALTSIATSTEIDEGKTITITGTLAPAVAGNTIILTYQPPSGSPITRPTTTTAAGEYSDTYTPNIPGSWLVTAYWSGDAFHEEATSPTVSFTVKASGCLIATATFGSDLAPHVQFLRSFRDHRVVSTFAGRQFMVVFNRFYYTWSPPVADTIRGNEVVRTMMRGVLSPLIWVLHVSEGVFLLLSFSPDIGVVSAGFTASTLLAGIYLVPFAVIISSHRKFRPSKRVRSAITLLWLASVAAIGIAQVTHHEVLMMAATGTFVLSTMGVTVVLAIHMSHLLVGMIPPRTRAGLT
jgi:hypothetical protein